MSAAMGRVAPMLLVLGGASSASAALLTHSAPLTARFAAPIPQRGGSPVASEGLQSKPICAEQGNDFGRRQ
eukprot:1916435-Pleurochrysis_carterae.AAC.1